MDAKSLLNISPLQSQSLVGFFFPSFICYPSVRQQTDSSSDPTLFHSSFTTYSLYSPPPFSHSLPSSPPPVLLCVVCRVKWRPGANKLSPPATLIRHTHTYIHIQSHHTSANSHNHKCTSALHTHTHTFFYTAHTLWGATYRGHLAVLPVNFSLLHTQTFIHIYTLYLCLKLKHEKKNCVLGERGGGDRWIARCQVQLSNRICFPSCPKGLAFGHEGLV